MTIETRVRTFACLVALAAAIHPPVGAQQEKSLRDQIETLAQSVRAKGAKVGLVVYSVKANETVYGIHERDPFMLASNTKLLTTAAALGRLGADFKFRTSVGILGGDLHVFAGGDPNLSGRFHDDDPTAILRDWAVKIKAAGVTKAGRLVLHTGIFDDVHLHPGWKSYELWNWWAAPFGALSLNDNCVDLRVAPAAEGQPCKVTLAPDTAYVTIVNQTKSSPKAARSTYSISRAANANTITIRGEVAGRNLSWVAVHDPARYFGTVFRETLAQGGIEVGPIEESAQPLEEAAGYRELAFWESDLPTTLATCNQPSQNFYAEMIFRTLGWKAKGKGTTENGIEAVREFLTREAGLEVFSQLDGSGLTRENRAAPAEIVKLLLFMRLHKQGKVFLDSLPVNGDRKGTLKNRMTAADVKGRIRAKTGHISGVSTLSGYVESAGGDTFVFSFLANAGEQGRLGPADAAQDRLCEILARHKGD